MTYLPCAMVYVSQYMYFGFAKSVLLEDTVRGCVPGCLEAAPVPREGKGGCQDRQPPASPGLCLGLRAEGTWRAGPGG